MSRRMRLLLFTAIALLIIAAIVVIPGGEVLTRGPLASAHSHLEGEPNCAKCHLPGNGMDDKLCLDCHEPLAQRIQGKIGYHAKVEGACNDCHRDHLGTDYEMIRWPPKDKLFVEVKSVKATKEEFDHLAGTGFALTGAHDLACDECHMPTLLVDAEVVEFKKEIQTYLGLGTDCASCHLNPHVPSQGDDCGKCHGDAEWKPAEKFDHGDTRYPLIGKHDTEVKCEECHLQTAPSKPPPPPPKPIPTFEGLLAKNQPQRFRGVGFGEAPAIPVEGEVLPGCTACHENPHRTGDETTFTACADCHTPHNWDQADSAPFDHAATGFTLDGGHAGVSCAKCHGEALNEPARNTCAECHRDDDEHKGGFDREMAVARKSCDQCHTVDDWKNATYVKQDHPLPLIERHDVKCEKCHGTDVTYPRLPARRPARIGPLEERCNACHEDPHKARLGNDCADCHGFKGWSDAPFTNAQHAAIGFPIVDAHAAPQVKCKDCHGGRNADGNLRKLSLSKVRVQGCVVCHEDEHVKQLSSNCTECHSEKVWVPSSYDDRKHRKARMPLKNAHLATPCGVCHVHDIKTKIRGRKKKHQRFKWSRQSTCVACHEDVHAGQFAKKTDCGACHSDKVWEPSTFGVRAHAKVGFPLEAAHDVACASCHVSGLKHGKAITYRGVPKDCAGCHDDVHLGQFANRGRGCEACHGLSDWVASKFDHNKKPCRFELVGAHKQLECSTCHITIKRGARDVVHYYPINKRAACDDCHVNPHASPGGDDK